jgi:heat shock protein HspQ
MARKLDMPLARFAIGDVVRHRLFDFRGVVFDVDPSFSNSEEWYQAIPEAMRPSKDQPFYHLLAENADTTYVAYVSQQNLIADESEEPSTIRISLRCSSARTASIGCGRTCAIERREDRSPPLIPLRNSPKRGRRRSGR